ncbi:MAG: SPOR domain-containing protein [Salinisphaera sp.]|nr:SPOR domain-containing protein [Salinisphaera sp.]
MDDVMRKRVVGAIVLLGLGVLLPVLLVWWLQPGGPVEGTAVRIYQIEPSGEAIPATGQAQTAGSVRDPVPAPPPVHQTPPVTAPAAPMAGEPSTPEPVATPAPAPPQAEASPKPEPAGQPKPPAPVSGPDWIVQVGSFVKESNARDMVADLQDRYSAGYQAATVAGKIYYRVQVGGFASEAEAEAAAARLRGAGYNTLIEKE